MYFMGTPQQQQQCEASESFFFFQKWNRWKCTRDARLCDCGELEDVFVPPIRVMSSAWFVLWTGGQLPTGSWRPITRTRWLVIDLRRMREHDVVEWWVDGPNLDPLFEVCFQKDYSKTVELLSAHVYEINNNNLSACYVKLKIVKWLMDVFWT